jgi:hypothetical protein
LRFYAYYQYLIKFDKNTDGLTEWMRVIYNLSENTDLRAENFVTAIQSIDKVLTELVKTKEDIIAYLQNKEPIGGFDRTQIKEEYRKAKLFRNEGWEGAIKKFEQHDYFRGQVNFLLEMSGEDLGKFWDYGEKCEEIFTYKNKKGGDKEFLLERALLTIDDYLMSVDWQNRYNRYSFGKMENTEKGQKRAVIRTWREHFFRNDNTLSGKKTLDIFEALLLKLDKNNVITSLDNIIKNWLATNTNDEYWKWQIIKYTNHINYCSCRIIRFNNEHDILLYHQYQSSHNHRELYSKSLYEKYFTDWKDGNLKLTPFTDFWHYQVSSASKRSRTVLHNFIRYDYNYAIDIYYIKGEFHLRLFNRNKAEIEDEIKTALDELSYFWRKDDGCYFYEKMKTNLDVISCLKAISDKLKPFKTPTP